LSVLREFPEFAAFVSGSRPERQDENERHRPTSSQIELSQTPDEAIINAYERLRASTAEELMDRVLAGSPYFFERLVLDVLTAMGYGGSRAEAAEHLGRSGDEGVDGVIHEDRLGLDVIYVQAKRWGRERTVGRPEVQAFVGALQGQRATKGVLITTAQFSAEALRYAQSISPRVVLVDGGELADLMIDYGVGVTVRDTFAVYRLDADYFHDEVEQLL
jgi:restriction system protein